MKRFIQGEHQGQNTLLPESLDDYVSDSNPVRIVDVFVDDLDLVNLGFAPSTATRFFRTVLAAVRAQRTGDRRSFIPEPFPRYLQNVGVAVFHWKVQVFFKHAAPG